MKQKKIKYFFIKRNCLLSNSFEIKTNHMLFHHNQYNLEKGLIKNFQEVNLLQNCLQLLTRFFNICRNPVKILTISVIVTYLPLPVPVASVIAMCQSSTLMTALALYQVISMINSCKLRIVKRNLVENDRVFFIIFTTPEICITKSQFKVEGCF